LICELAAAIEGNRIVIDEDGDYIMQEV